jgi:ATP-dependent Clp protease protease subunit
MAIKTELDDFLSYGIDSKHRRIYYGDCINQAGEDSGEVTQRSIELAVRALHRLASEGPGRPIELHMNSPGGDPYAMLRLHDEILSCPCQVKFYGGGIIQSSATWIMAVCDERYLHPNTTVMVHDGTEGFEGTHTDVKIALSESVRLQDMLYDVYAANSRMPRSFWEDVCQRDLYLTAEETVKLGLADKIVEPRKRGNLRKARVASLKKAPTHVEMETLVHKLYQRVNRHNVPKLELNKPVKEESDPTLKIDESPVVVSTDLPPPVTGSTSSTSQ